MKKKYLLFLLLISFTVYSQKNTDNLRLYDNFEPINQDNIFKTEGYYNWGSSIIKGKDGKYHIFYSRWKKEYGFNGWLTHSEIAHATSKKFGWSMEI